MDTILLLFIFNNNNQPIRRKCDEYSDLSECDINNMLEAYWRIFQLLFQKCFKPTKIKHVTFNFELFYSCKTLFIISDICHRPIHSIDYSLFSFYHAQIISRYHAIVWRCSARGDWKHENSVLWTLMCYTWGQKYLNHNLCTWRYVRAILLLGL